MSISVACNCGKHLNFGAGLAGQRTICPDCKATLTVPAASAAAPTVPPTISAISSPASVPVSRWPLASRLASVPLPLLLGVPFLLGLGAGVWGTIGVTSLMGVASGGGPSRFAESIAGRPAKRVLPDIPADPNLPDLRANVQDHMTRYRTDPEGIEFLEWAGPVAMADNGIVDRLTAAPKGPFFAKLEVLTRTHGVMGEHLSRDMFYFNKDGRLAWVTPTAPGHCMDPEP